MGESVAHSMHYWYSGEGLVWSERRTVVCVHRVVGDAVAEAALVPLGRGVVAAFTCGGPSSLLRVQHNGCTR